ncbi:hypothetical protein SDC9_97535 [bioreactor metagenome]|uniref:Uncharacterized protein n=1 Tax=bioreactor metagenome TaxID=1076179 RepID=A0A645AC65_9ZZZZ
MQPVGVGRAGGGEVQVALPGAGEHPPQRCGVDDDELAALPAAVGGQEPGPDEIGPDHPVALAPPLRGQRAEVGVMVGGADLVDVAVVGEQQHVRRAVRGAAGDGAVEVGVHQLGPGRRVVGPVLLQVTALLECAGGVQGDPAGGVGPHPGALGRYPGGLDGRGQLVQAR